MPSASRKTGLAIVLLTGLALGCQIQVGGDESGDEAASTATSAADAEAARAAIEARTDEWEAAVLAADTAGAVAVYADDAVVIGPGMPPMRGADEVRAFFQGMLSQASIEEVSIAFDRLEVSDSGDLAWAVGTNTGRVALPDGSEAPIEDRFLVVFEKIDGEWKMVADVWNTPGTAE